MLDNAPLNGRGRATYAVAHNLVVIKEFGAALNLYQFDSYVFL
jgi:hypothetical protein